MARPSHCFHSNTPQATTRPARKPRAACPDATPGKRYTTAARGTPARWARPSPPSLRAVPHRSRHGYAPPHRLPARGRAEVVWQGRQLGATARAGQRAALRRARSAPRTRLDRDRERPPAAATRRTRPRPTARARPPQRRQALSRAPCRRATAVSSRFPTVPPRRQAITCAQRTRVCPARMLRWSGISGILGRWAGGVVGAES